VHQDKWTDDQLNQTLKQHFGLTSFRTPQLEIIRSVLSRRDTLAILPTGGGKSLCYQLPSLLLDGTTLVVSPLIALMKDQVDKLNLQGIKAGFINSAQPSEEQTHQLELFILGYYQIFYVSPERLQSASFFKACHLTHIPLIAVDESHCISQWGTEFRPEFRRIYEFVEKLPVRPRLLALTATASPRVEQDIQQSLHFQTAQVFRSSVLRPNIQIQIINPATISAKILILGRLLKSIKNQTGLVYTATRLDSEYLHQFFGQFESFKSFHLHHYHAGLPQNQRAMIQNQFLSQTSSIIFATNAFGMGIDRSDIKLVVHFHLPGSLEAYAQEIGRAGRNGQPSLAVLLLHQHDLKIQSSFIQKNMQPENRAYQVLELQDLLAFCRSKSCRSQLIQSYFGEAASPRPCLVCDNCLKNHTIPTPVRQPFFLPFSSLPEQQKLTHLLEVRQRLATQHHLESAEIIPTSTCLWWAMLEPKTVRELLCVPGIGKGWVKEWGRKFLPKLGRHQ